jgi:hypothetical protein
MSRVAPYHTNSKEYAAQQREVYHNHDNCPAGRQIRPEHRVPGTGARPRCADCMKLG